MILMVWRKLRHTFDYSSMRRMRRQENRRNSSMAQSRRVYPVKEMEMNSQFPMRPGRFQRRGKSDMR